MKKITNIFLPSKIFLLIILIILAYGCSERTTANPFLTMTSTDKDILINTPPTGKPETVKATQPNTATVTPRVKDQSTPITNTPSPKHPAATLPLPETATWTPRPTLTAKDAEALVLELIKTNNGCELPCWWGITPGVTTWNDARSFLETFMTDITEVQRNLFWVTYKNRPDEQADIHVGVSIVVENGIVKSICTNRVEELSLPQLLQKFGKPDEIRISANRNTIDPKAPYMIALFYKNHGILTSFSGRTAKRDVMPICPGSLTTKESLWLLWSPNEKMTFTQAGEAVLFFGNGPDDSTFYKLDEVTDMDIQAFYDTYRDPKSASKCFSMKVPEN